MPFLPQLNSSTSLMTYVLLGNALLNNMPPQLKDFLQLILKKITSWIQPKMKEFTIHEFEDSVDNPLFSLVHSYLGTNCVSAAPSISLLIKEDSTDIIPPINEWQQVEDVFNGIKVFWMLKSRSKQAAAAVTEGERYYSLRLNAKDAAVIQNRYLAKVRSEAREIQTRRRERKLYTNRGGDSAYWTGVALNHPSTFETVALDPNLKAEIIRDLDQFVRGRAEYERLGKTWKRGYLLYGPPGTGKTSLIGAIANRLEYDIYDLELSCVQDNSQLRRLLIATSKRSIIVVEDVDCTTVDLSDRTSEGVPATASKLSLSGILNFADGLWSSVGGRR